MAYVYLLVSEKDEKSYVGSTNNLEKRFSEHRLGLCKATKYRRPLRLVYQEEFSDLISARTREKFLKTRSGRRELKSIFQKLNIGA